VCINKEKGLHAEICHLLFRLMFWQISIIFNDKSSYLCIYEQIRPYDGTVNTLHWLFLACGWYVLDTCWNNIFNRKQCSMVKMKNGVVQIAKINGWLERLISPPLLAMYFWESDTGVDVLDFVFLFASFFKLLSSTSAGHFDLTTNLSMFEMLTKRRADDRRICNRVHIIINKVWSACCIIQWKRWAAITSCLLTARGKHFSFPEKVTRKIVQACTKVTCILYFPLT